MNRLKTTLLLGGLTALVLAVGYYFGGEQGALIALILSAVMNFGSYWFSDKIVLALALLILTPIIATLLHLAISKGVPSCRPRTGGVGQGRLYKMIRLRRRPKKSLGGSSRRAEPRGGSFPFKVGSHCVQ